MRAQTVIADPAEEIGPAMLAWYDRHARVLPWRIGPAARKKDVRPDPYRVWLSEVMLQQTTAATVAPRFDAFLARWPTVEELAATPVEEVLGEWAGLGYYARARNLHRCARRVVHDFDGVFPDTEDALSALPGVGAYTAAAIAAIAFDRPVAVVDGNVERVMARLYAIDDPLPTAKPLLQRTAASIWPRRRSGDFAQGLMDLGATICRPRAPICDSCPLEKFCAARSLSAPEAYPKKATKKAKPVRRGAAFALFRRDGRVLLERRSHKGLLGGMLGLPTTDWTPGEIEDPLSNAPARATWRRLGDVRHVFTHFRLYLDVYAASGGRRVRRGEEWADPDTARVPTVMQKALDLAIASRKEGSRK
ncbi:MAG: A/G-specific adenine glycosylase [Parvularculaceae bacterium]